MSGLDLLILGGFLVYAIGSGFRSQAKASENLEEYFLAGRSLKGWKAGISMAATQFAADTPLLVTGLIATSGIFALWQMWIYALSFLLMGFLLAPSWRRVEVLTDAELTELRYSQKPAAVLRATKAVYFGILFNCTVLAWVLFAAAKISEPFLFWDLWLPDALFSPFVSLIESVGIPLTMGGDYSGGEIWVRSASNFISILSIVLVTTLYSTTGGLRSVVNTDVAQFFLMMLGTLVYAYIVTSEVGGLSEIPNHIERIFNNGGPNGILPSQILAFTPSQALNASAPILMVFAFQWLIQLNSDGTGYLAQRSMACSSDREAKIAAIVFTVVQVLFRSLLWLPIGVGLLIIFPPDLALEPALLQPEREATFVKGIAELLPSGVRGLVLTGMLAALASTVDTHLNWGSSYCTNDLYKRFICKVWLKKTPSERSLVWVARGSNLLILSIALLIGTQLTSIQKAWQTSLLLGAGMGTVLILRWLWWRMNAWAEIAAIVSSLIFSPLLLIWLSDDQQALRLLLIALISTVSALGAIFYFGPEPKSVLKAFFDKARPSGYWSPIIDSPIERKRTQMKLWRALVAVAFGALCLFSLLIAIGTLLVGGTPPVWIESRVIWVVSLVLLSAVSLPLCIKFGFESEELKKTSNT